MSDKIRNAQIVSARLLYEGYGRVVAVITLQIGAQQQCITEVLHGGYDIGGRFIQRMCDTVDSLYWDDLNGKFVRVVVDDSGVEKIGNLLYDRWFCPRLEIQKWKEVSKPENPESALADLFQLVALRVTAARKKHPVVGRDSHHAMTVLMEEVGELSRAVLDGDNENAEEELLDCMAVLARIGTEIFNGEV